MKLIVCVFNDAVYTEPNTEVASRKDTLGACTNDKPQYRLPRLDSNQRHSEYKAPRRDI